MLWLIHMPRAVMSDTERYELLQQIVGKSKIRVVCPKCFHPSSGSKKLKQHFRSLKDDIHQGLALNKEDPPTFREKYREAIGKDVHDNFLRDNQKNLFDIFFIFDQKLPDLHEVGEHHLTIQLHFNVSLTGYEKLRTLTNIVKPSKIRVVCPNCLHPYPRTDELYKHFREQEKGEPETAEIYKGLAQRPKDTPDFRESYKKAVGNYTISPDLLRFGEPVFAIWFVIEQKLARS